MSDEQPDTGPDATTPDATTPDATTPDATSPGRSRPATPGAAASRRARQLGGPRRPLPHARAADEADTTATDTASAAPAAPTTRKAAGGGTRTTTARTATRPGTTSGVGVRRPRPTTSTADTADTATATDEADTTGADDDTGTASPARSRRLLVGATALLAVALLAVGVVFLVLTLTAQPAISAAETERALAAAKSDVALVTTYGYQTVDADAAKAAAVLTGEFRSQYLDSISTVVKPQLPTTQTVTTGQVDTAGLVSADAKGRQVVVLVYGQQSVTNKAQTTPRIDAFQIRVTMQLVDGRWLVAQLDQLGNNA